MQRRKFITSSILGLLLIPFIPINKLFTNNKENESMRKARRALKRAKEVLKRSEKYCHERIETLQMARSVEVPENIHINYNKNFSALSYGYHTFSIPSSFRSYKRGI